MMHVSANEKAVSLNVHRYTEGAPRPTKDNMPKLWR
jgi:hypothetical protein